jgi:hypothetical protein
VVSVVLTVILCVISATTYQTKLRHFFRKLFTFRKSRSVYLINLMKVNCGMILVVRFLKRNYGFYSLLKLACSSALIAGQLRDV